MAAQLVVLYNKIKVFTVSNQWRYSGVASASAFCMQWVG